MKTIIAGTRTNEDYSTLEAYCDYILSEQPHSRIEIVSGNCEGTDALGERYAMERGFKLATFPADWTRYGKAAGPIRNKEMAVYADALIAFWDGKSKGTANMIKTAKDLGLKVRVKKI